jgi:hypothetical protein
MPLQASALTTALGAGQGDLQAIYEALGSAERAGAAGLALSCGRPEWAARWAADPRHPAPLVRAAALLRLGRATGALEALDAQPPTARTAVLQARAHWQLGEPGNYTDLARTAARQEGDTPALQAAVTLAGEQGLAAPHAALRVLAEGLKVAELTGQPADAHLLAVLAHAQLRLGGPKGRRTAGRALERSAARSPARVLALLALDHDADALKGARDGQIHPVWWEEVRMPRR